MQLFHIHCNTKVRWPFLRVACLLVSATIVGLSQFVQYTISAGCTSSFPGQASSSFLRRSKRSTLPSDKPTAMSPDVCCNSAWRGFVWLPCRGTPESITHSEVT